MAAHSAVLTFASDRNVPLRPCRGKWAHALGDGYDETLARALPVPPPCPSCFAPLSRLFWLGPRWAAALTPRIPRFRPPPPRGVRRRRKGRTTATRSRATPPCSRHASAMQLPSLRTNRAAPSRCTPQSSNTIALASSSRVASRRASRALASTSEPSTRVPRRLSIGGTRAAQIDRALARSAVRSRCARLTLPGRSRQENRARKMVSAPAVRAIGLSSLGLPRTTATRSRTPTRVAEHARGSSASVNHATPRGPRATLATSPPYARKASAVQPRPARTG